MFGNTSFAFASWYEWGEQGELTSARPEYPIICTEKIIVVKWSDMIISIRHHLDWLWSKMTSFDCYELWFILFSLEELVRNLYH